MTTKAKILGYTDLVTVTTWLKGRNMVLCNEIDKIDETVRLNAEDVDFEDIFQFYITDFSEDDVKYLQASFEGLLFSYSDKLNCYIWLMDRFGTPWTGEAVGVKREMVWDTIVTGNHPQLTATGTVINESNIPF